MTTRNPVYPTTVWDGTSPSRSNRKDDREPDFQDWDAIVAEVIATQEQTDTNISDIAAIDISGIATNATDIATNVTNIGTNATDIATNVTNIGTNTTNIATNVTNIGTNTTNIATNVTNIGTNTTDIATNTSAIAGLSGGALFVQTAQGQVVSTTTDTSVIAAGVGSLTVDGLSSVVGDTYRFKIAGIISTKASGAGTLQLRPKWKTNVLGFVTVTLTNNLVDKAFNCEVLVTVRALGSAGKFWSAGVVSVSTAANDMANHGMIQTALSTINLDEDSIFDYFAKFSVADSANDLRIDMVTLEKIK